ncbi:unnamed protein product, partial [Ectocarpus sp. 12 AP-2014]
VVVVVVVVECVISLSAVLVLYRVCSEFYERKSRRVERVEKTGSQNDAKHFYVRT